MSPCAEPLVFRGAVFLDPHGTRRALDASVPFGAVGLLGDFSPLLAHLRGEMGLSAGSVMFGKAPAREAILDGTLGVMPSPALFGSSRPLRDLLMENLLLLGFHKRDAERQVADTLAALSAEKAGRLRFAQTTPAERYRLGLAFAALTKPQAVVIAAPPEGAHRDEVTQAALGELAARSSVVMLIDDLRYLPPAPYLRFGVWVDGEVATLTGDQDRYHVVAQGAVDVFLRAVNDRGIDLRPVVSGTRASGPGFWPEVDLVATVPEDLGIATLFGVAHDSGAALLMVSRL